MNESEEKLSSQELKKEKIRERYKGINPEEIEVIPAMPQIRLDDPDRVQRVAVYARVSTDDPNQTSSYELQKNHYQDVVNSHMNWVLVDIYADEGISGTSLKHRDAFIRMMLSLHNPFGYPWKIQWCYPSYLLQELHRLIGKVSPDSLIAFILNSHLFHKKRIHKSNRCRYMTGMQNYPALH